MFTTHDWEWQAYHLWPIYLWWLGDGYDILLPTPYLYVVRIIHLPAATGEPSAFDTPWLGQFTGSSKARNDTPTGTGFVNIGTGRILDTNWLVVDLPSEKYYTLLHLIGGAVRLSSDPTTRSEKYEFVSWDDDIPYQWRNTKWSKPPATKIAGETYVQMSLSERFPTQTYLRPPRPTAQKSGLPHTHLLHVLLNTKSPPANGATDGKGQTLKKWLLFIGGYPKSRDCTIILRKKESTIKYPIFEQIIFHTHVLKFRTVTPGWINRWAVELGMYHLMGKSSLFWGPKSINQGCKGSQDYCRATPKIGWLASQRMCIPKNIYIYTYIYIHIYIYMANIWYLRLSYFWGRMMISHWIFGYTIFRLIQKYGTSWYICNFYGWFLGQM